MRPPRSAVPSIQPRPPHGRRRIWAIFHEPVREVNHIVTQHTTPPGVPESPTPVGHRCLRPVPPGSRKALLAKNDLLVGCAARRYNGHVGFCSVYRVSPIARDEAGCRAGCLGAIWDARLLSRPCAPLAASIAARHSFDASARRRSLPSSIVVTRAPCLPALRGRARDADAGSQGSLALAPWCAALFQPALAKEVLVWRFAVPRYSSSPILS